MSKPKRVVTEREVRLARAFLHAIQADEANGYLLLAIIAWGRAMTLAKDPFWKGLARLGAKSAGIALAKRLRAKMHAHPDQYKGLTALLKRRTSKQDAQVEAAQSFLLIIETSNYDAKHYGYVEGKDGYWKYHDRSDPDPGLRESYTWVPPIVAADPLAKAWQSITGYPIPPAWFNDPITVTKPVTIPPRPSQPRSLQHVLPVPDYLAPYAARDFYEARPHYGDFLLPVD